MVGAREGEQVSLVYWRLDVDACEMKGRQLRAWVLVSWSRLGCERGDKATLQGQDVSVAVDGWLCPSCTSMRPVFCCGTFCVVGVYI